MAIRILAIVVTHDGEYYVEKCLQSLVDSKTLVDVLVIDNQSSDKTVPLIQNKFPQVLLKLLDQNLGFGQANNIGFKKAINEDYDFVLLLNQDAWIKPDAIENVISEIDPSNKADRSRPEYGIYCPIQLQPDSEQWHSMLEFYCPASELERLKGNTDNSRLSTISMAPAAIWLMPVATLKIVGGFDPIFFQYGEDDNLVDRLHYHGFKIALVHNSFGYHEDYETRSRYRSYYQRQKTFIIKQTLYKLLNNELETPLEYLRKVLLKRILKYNLTMKWEDARDLRKIYRELPELVAQMLSSASESKKKAAFLN